jgi:hypothetical protein
VSRKGIFNSFIVFSLCVFFIGCAPSFKNAHISSNTGQFESKTEVEPKCIKTYTLLPGVKNAKYVYLKASYSYNDNVFYSFLKNGLMVIGIDNVMNEKEVSTFILSKGLSNYVTSISDPISLHNLAEVSGPFLFIEADLKMVTDVVYRFDLKVTDPATNKTLLDVSRVRLVWLDLDKEVNLPMLNLIKKWYDESAEIKGSDEEIKATPPKIGI